MTAREALPAPLRARGRRRRGYTIIEVMMALAVLAFGTSGVIAMQKATLISNTNARNLATANSIAQGWIERLRVDALAWNEPAGVVDLADTEWINGAALGPLIAGGGWVTPASVGLLNNQPAASSQEDVMGADLYAGLDPLLSTAYCTQIRLTRFATLRPQPNAPLINASAFYPVIRIEVRVIWDRRSQPLSCLALPAGFDVTGVGRYGITYAVTAVMENASPF